MSEAEALLLWYVELGHICTCSDKTTCFPCKAEALLIRSGFVPKIPTMTLQEDG